MRTLSLFAILLALPAYAAERTWTIARDVYTAEAALIAVRGNLAYLKIDGAVEEIPLERLSAVDQQYIASLSLAPIAPGPQADTQQDPATHSLLVQEEMPLPGEPESPAAAREPNEPELALEYGGAPIRRPLEGDAYRVDQYGRTIPPHEGMTANYLAPQGGWVENANPNDRRTRRPQQQGPGNQAANAKRDDDDRSGLFGARARRERQRAAAARSR